jgi:hypothetical protein
MSRIYTEIRIAHRDEDQKRVFETALTDQCFELGDIDRTEYIKLIVSLNAAAKIISKLKEGK